MAMAMLVITLLWISVLEHSTLVKFIHISFIIY